MIPTTLLVPVREHDAAIDADRALALCGDVARHLSFVVYAETAPPPLMTAQGAVEAAVWAESISSAAEALHARARLLGEHLEAAGVSHDVDVAFHEGWATERDLGRRARRADLTVLPRYMPSHDPLQRHLLSGALFHSARPLLLVPEREEATLAFRRVLVAWNGEISSARALEAALPIVREADEVTLVSVDEEGEGAHGGDGAASGESPRGVVAWLRRHGVAPTVDCRTSEGGRVAETLSRVAAARRADLVVSGAYGRSELRERYFGGTTRELLAACPAALLLAH